MVQEIIDIFFWDNKNSLGHIPHIRGFFQLFQAAIIYFVQTMIQYTICKFETKKRRVIHLFEENPNSMKRWLLFYIKLKFIETLEIFKTY